MVLKGECRYAEVLYFFMIHKGDLQHILAAVNMFTVPDPDILIESYGTLHVCRPSDEGVEVVDAKSLTDVIGMIPFQRQGGSDREEFFPIEKMGLMSVQMSEDDDT